MLVLIFIEFIRRILVAEAVMEIRNIFGVLRVAARGKPSVCGSDVSNYY